MSTRVYDIGDLVRIATSVSSSSGYIDSSIRLVVETPSGVATKYTTASTSLLHSTVGKWQVDVPATEAGRWTYQWTSTGTVLASEPGAFAVRPPAAST